MAAFSAQLHPEGLPADVREDARRRLRDTVGVCLAGSRLEHAALVREYANSLGGHPEATTVGFGQRLPATLASFVNAALAHGPDYDDTHSGTMAHISSVVVPAALAMAERADTIGAELLTAMIAGAEVGLRIGSAASHRFHMRGLHSTLVVGPFAAAATACRLLRLDPGHTANAMGIAGSQAAGLRQSSFDGSWVKRLHSGFAAQSGITAALLAKGGFTGPRAVLEGQSGLYAAFLRGEDIDAERALEGLGEHWLYPQTVYKPYPNGAWNHASMDATASIMQRKNLRYTDIERLDVTVPPECMPSVCEPREVRIHPRTAYHMKFSLPFSVAILAVLGRVEVDDYNEKTRQDSRIVDLAARVWCHAERGMSPEGFPARVRLTTRAGQVFEEAVLAQRGGPGLPMTEAEHRAKFLGNSLPSLGEARSAKLLRALDTVWTAPRVSTMMRATVI